MTDRVIRVVLDSSGVVSGARGASGALGGLNRRSGAVSAGFRAAARAATALAAALSFRELVRTADTFNQIQNSLRVVTDSTEELNVANERLFEIAQQTRAPLQATAELFSRASIAADELGASQEDLFRLTEITGQALAVQGGAASESAGALRQLSQSFASGIVRAEEFNSILEGAFPLAQAAARGIDEAGGSVGRLRNLVVEGEITSREFFEAILAGGGELESQFAATVPTVAQGLTTLQNAFISFVGQVDAASGASASLAGFLIDMADNLGTLGDAITGNLDPGDELTENMEQFAVALIAAGAGVEGLFGVLGVMKALFVDIGREIGGSAAAIAAFFSGDFEQAARIQAEVVAASGENFQAATTDFLESFGETVDEASLKINDVLLPSFRAVREEAAAIQEDTGGGAIVDPNAIEDIEAATDATTDFLEALRVQTGELAIQAQLGEEADEAIRQYREGVELAAAANEAFGDLVPTEEVLALKDAFIAQGEEALAAQRALREEIEAAELKETFDEQIESLQEEILLLGADNEVIAANAEARALAAGATAEQAAQIGMLTETLLDEQDALQRETATLQGFFEEVGASAQETLSGFLADPLAEGLDELPFKFAQTLQQLAADALASELFTILGGLGGGGEGGGFLGFIGGLFGGGRQAGGAVRAGQPVLVGERGPELFRPPGSGDIAPNVSINQAAQAPPIVNVVNVTDPNDIPAGIETPEGEAAVINAIQRNPEAVRRLLG
jgi:tape measure domain-containing protein